MRGIQADCRTPTIKGINGQKTRSNHASLTVIGGRGGRMRACCDHAAAGAGTRNRRIFRLVFKRHGRGENQRAGALLRARQRQGGALSVGVGRIGKQWSGTAYISSKQLRPAWSPPAEVKRDKP